MAQGRSVKKKKFVFSSNAVCRPESWRFERRVTRTSAHQCPPVRECDCGIGWGFGKSLGG
eukprot:6356410-Prymnesium_polylepis.1